MSNHITVWPGQPKTCGTCIWLDSNSDCECTTHAVTEDTVCDCPPEFGHYERRTCGNCNLSDHEELLCGLEYEDGSRDNITLDAPACIYWCKRYVSDEERIEQLEQRCQQLEQQYEVVIAALLESEKRYQQLEQIAKSLLGIAHGAAEEIRSIGGEPR